MTGEERTLEQLVELGRTAAPPGLLAGVLARTGLGYWYASADSPLGRIFVGHGPLGIAAIRLASEGNEAFEAWFHAEHGVWIRPRPALPEPVREAFEARLVGRRRTLALDLSGRTLFQRSVLQAATRIPRGEVRTYAWVAREIGHPAAVRAVGSALARNPVPLAVPCHRVVGSDLRLGRYSCGGPEQKRRALLAEGLDVDRLEQLATAGVRYLGNHATGVFCTPSCSVARRTSPAQQIRFGSEQEARAAGYRPCSRCRPVGVAA